MLLGGLIFQTDIQWNYNFSTATFSAIVIPTLIALKHLIAVSSRWPRGPLVKPSKARTVSTEQLVAMFSPLNLL